MFILDLTTPNPTSPYNGTGLGSGYNPYLDATSGPTAPTGTLPENRSGNLANLRRPEATPATTANSDRGGIRNMFGGMFGGAGRQTAQILRALIGLLRTIAGIQPSSNSPSSPQSPAGTPRPPVAPQNPLERIIRFLESLAAFLEGNPTRTNSTESSSQFGSGSSSLASGNDSTSGSVSSFGPPGIGPGGSGTGATLGSQSPVFAAGTDLLGSTAPSFTV